MTQDTFRLIGRVVEKKYRVDAMVGEGGFGVVYRGTDVSLGDRAIAIKCLKVPPWLDDDARRTFVEQFKREGELLVRLKGAPAIVTIYSYGTMTVPAGNVVPYLVLEWLDGEQLDSVVAKRKEAGLGPFGEEEALKLLRPVVDALAFAHTMPHANGVGIAHRDLKLANLMQVRTHRDVAWKVLDFGIAKVMQDGETPTLMGTQTSSGVLSFSPAYGAPEQFRAKRLGATGPWTDVHALGLIFTELVTGWRAYYGTELVGLIEEAFAAERPTPRARGARVSDAFEAMCAKALAIDPKQRFANADELLKAMDELLASGVGTTAPLASLATAAPEPPPRPSATEAGLGAPPVSRAVVETQRTLIAPPPTALTSSRASAPSPTPVASSRTPVPAATLPKHLPWAAVAGVVVLAGAAWAVHAARDSTTAASPPRSVAVADPSSTATAPAQPADPTEAPRPAPAAELPAENDPRPQPRRPGSVIAPVVPVMVPIPGGTLTREPGGAGSTELAASRETVLPFKLDRTEVTAAAYSLCVRAGECPQPAFNGLCTFGQAAKDEQPINCVGDDEAASYCRWRGARLPTESEWEYAARGTTRGAASWGGEAADTPACTVREGPCPVAPAPAGNGPIGLRGMSGNVFEWTSSGWSLDYRARAVDPAERGHGQDAAADVVRGPNRHHESPTGQEHVGFRCAADVGTRPTE